MRHLSADYEHALKKTLEEDRHYARGTPEMRIGEVFKKLYQEKGIMADKELAIHTGQFFRVRLPIMSVCIRGQSRCLPA